MMSAGGLRGRDEVEATGIVETIVGRGVVDDANARRALEVLIGLLSVTPDDSDALDAARAIVGRMEPEGALTALFDWWLVAECGANPVTPLAYHPPESVPPTLRRALHDLLALNVPAPKAQWLRNQDRFRELWSQLDERLDLEFYGQSRLSQERDVWDEMLDTIAPTLSALRTGERAPELHFDQTKYERHMTKVSIVKSSRRWNEMTKRARELMDFLLVLVDLQHRVEPWSGAQSPAPLSISEMGIQNDDFVPLACVASLTPSRSMEIDPADVARRLQDEAQATDDRGRTLLARIAETWLERTSLTVPALATPLARLASIGRERTRLEQSEVDLTEIDLALLDNDLDGAERAIDALGDARRAAEARAKVKSAQERLRARLEGRADGGWTKANE